MPRRLLAAFLAACLSATAHAGPCVQWRAPEKLGTLDASMIGEASGIAASRAHPGRLYHNNDSGDGPYVYLTDGAGGSTRRVAIAGFEPRDVEDIALGRCAGSGTCLYVGDIGDNSRARDTVRFVQLAELDQFPGEVAPLRIVEARYPDGPHDAESFALHPNGDLFLITKAVDFQARTSAAAQIFRLTAAQLAAPSGEVQTFEPVGTIDLPALIADASRPRARRRWTFPATERARWSSPIAQCSNGSRNSRTRYRRDRSNPGAITREAWNRHPGERTQAGKYRMPRRMTPGKSPLRKRAPKGARG